MTDGERRLEDDVLDDLLRRATSLRYADGTRAHALARAAVTLAAESGSFSGEAMARLTERQTLCQLDRFEEAVEVLGDAASQFEQLGDRANRALAVLESAEAHLYLDHVGQAIDAYQEALVIAGDRAELLTARARVGIARVMHRCGVPSRAVSTLEQVVADLEPLEDRFTLAAALNALGLALEEVGEPGAARARLEAALALCDTERLVVLGAGCRTNLGQILVENGQAARGGRYLEEALTTFRQVAHPRGTAFALLRRSEMLCARGELPAALDAVLEAIRVSEESGVIKLPAWCHERAALICADLGRQSEAYRHQQRFLELVHQMHPDLSDQRDRALAFADHLAARGHRPDHDLDELEARVKARAEALGLPISRRGREFWARPPEDGRAVDDHHDPLTGLPERDHVTDLLRPLLEQRRADRHLAVLVCDLVGLTPVNNSLGRQAADDLLLGFAARLQAELRPVDLAGRVSNDQFVVVLVGLTGSDRALTVARRLRQAAAQPVRVYNTEVVMTPAIGVAISPEHGNDGPTLLRYAELAVHAAKGTGSGIVAYEDGSVHAGDDFTDSRSAIAG